mmetsp:Transcript_91539/g.230089  ORF Transcript_91539/g.230089 Transcript_91539/m.230089 type:complete len:334 (-) Transcript_91539:606-1607(-)
MVRADIDVGRRRARSGTQTVTGVGRGGVRDVDECLFDAHVDIVLSLSASRLHGDGAEAAPYRSRWPGCDEDFVPFRLLQSHVHAGSIFPTRNDLLHEHRQRLKHQQAIDAGLQSGSANYRAAAEERTLWLGRRPVSLCGHGLHRVIRCHVQCCTIRKHHLRPLDGPRLGPHLHHGSVLQVAAKAVETQHTLAGCDLPELLRQRLALNPHEGLRWQAISLARTFLGVLHEALAKHCWRARERLRDALTQIRLLRMSLSCMVLPCTHSCTRVLEVFLGAQVARLITLRLWGKASTIFLSGEFRLAAQHLLLNGLLSPLLQQHKYLPSRALHHDFR